MDPKPKLASLDWTRHSLAFLGLLFFHLVGGRSAQAAPPETEVMGEGNKASHPDQDLQFRTAILELRSPSAQKLRKAVELRLPKLEVITWSAERSQIKAPFVLIRILKEASATKHTPSFATLRFLTDQGRMYERPLPQDPNDSDLLDRPHDLAREIASFLLAIQGGLVAPKEEPPGDDDTIPANSDKPEAPERPQSEIPVTTNSPSLNQKKEAETPPKKLRSSTPPPVISPWSYTVTPTALFTPPPPRFDRFWGGAGLSLATDRSFAPAYFVHLEGRWLYFRSAKKQTGIHRLRVASGIGLNKNLISSKQNSLPSILLRYRPVVQLSLAPWKANTEHPNPDFGSSQRDSGLLVGASISQSLLWRVMNNSQIGLEIGPTLEVGYAVDLLAKGRAVGIYFVPEGTNPPSVAIARIGGMDLSAGVTLRVFRLKTSSTRHAR